MAIKSSLRVEWPLDAMFECPQAWKTTLDQFLIKKLLSHCTSLMQVSISIKSCAGFSQLHMASTFQMPSIGQLAPAQSSQIWSFAGYRTCEDKNHHLLFHNHIWEKCIIGTLHWPQDIHDFFLFLSLEGATFQSREDSWRENLWNNAVPGEC